MKRIQQCLTTALLGALMLLAAACGSTQTVPERKAAADHTEMAGYPVTVSNYDYLENRVEYTYHKAPKRVVLTHPGATELLLELGLEEHILATIAPYGQPLERVAEKYARLTVMKSQYVPPVEELLEMQPDLIIGWVQQFAPQEMGEVKSWHKRGIGTYILPGTLLKTKPTLENSVYRNIEDIGRIFAIQPAAAAFLQSLQQRVERVREKVGQPPQKKSVLVLQDHFNGTFSLYDSSYLISHLVDIAGGRNLCEARTSFVGAEKVLQYDPDVIIFVSVNPHAPAEDLSDAQAVQALQSVSALRSMRAVQQGNIINLPFFTVNNGGSRSIDAIEKIAAGLYPGKFQ